MIQVKRRGKALRRGVGEEIARIIAFILFTSIALTYLYLVFWCFYTGTRDSIEISKNAFAFTKPNFNHYAELFTKFKDQNGNTFFDMFLNSMYFSFLGPFLSIFVTSQLAYVTAKYRFPGSGIIYFIVLVVITLPIYGTQGAMYKLLFNLNIVNSRLMILTSLNGFSIYYLYFYSFYRNLSWTYAEAGMIDGANDYQIYFKVMLPQSLVMFGSLFLMLWIADWNNYQSALLYLPKLPTLSVGLYNFKLQMQYGGGRSDLLYAGCAVSIIPPLLLYIFCNNALMSNVSIGGIKE